ncbi:hypothetical protein Tco_0025482 [Tanacetum coccineum]
MIGSLMYLTASKPDIQFSTCLYARYQANLKKSHLIVVKRIFRYLKDSDYVGCNMDMKRTLGACQLLGGKLMCWSAKKKQSIAMSPAEAEYIAAARWEIELHFIPTEYQLADIFTKPLDQPNFKRLIVELGGILGEVGVTTFRNAIGANYLSHSSEYAELPSLETVREWFPTIRYSGEIKAKGTLKKGLHSPMLRLLMGQIKQCLGGKTGNIGSPIGHSKKKKESSSTKDSNPRQPPASTLVVGRLHKEAQQATGGLTSLGVTSEERVNPQLSRYDASADSTTEADLGKFAPNDSISQQKYGLKTAHTESGTNKESNNAKKEFSYDSSEFNTSSDFTSSNETTKEIKLNDLSKLMPNVEVDFMDLDLPEDDEPIIIQDDDEEEVHAKKVRDEHHKETKDALASQPTSPNSLKPELSKLLSFHDFSNSLPTELKELPSKFKDITGEIRELKKFAQAIEAASYKAGDQCVPLAGQASTHPAEGEKNTRPATITYLFKQRTKKDDEKENLKTQPIPKTSPITTTKKGKEAMTLKETEEESETNSEFEVRPTSSMVESSKKKKLNKFDFVTEEGDHIHFTEEQIKEQKRIEESVKADRQS